MINLIFNMYGLFNMAIQTLVFLRENEGKDIDFTLKKLKSLVSRWVIFLLLWYFESLIKYSLFFFPLISVLMFLLKFKIITMNSNIHDIIYGWISSYYIENNPLKFLQHKISHFFILILGKINDNESRLYKIMNYE